MRRRLFVLALVVVAGYVIGRADAAYGHAPWLIVCLTAAVSWLAGGAHAALPLTLAVAEANRERDLIAARLAQIEDGGSYAPTVPIRRGLRIINCDGQSHRDGRLQYTGPCDKQSCRSGGVG